MTFGAGQLPHIINIVQPSNTQDSFGGTDISSYTAYASNVPAGILTLSGRELISAQQKVSEVTHEITIRWQSGIKAKMNVTWLDDGITHFFQIQDVQNRDGRHILLKLLCIERDDSARNV